MEDTRTKVLVIDDDPAVLAVLEMRFSDNYVLVCTDDPAGAVSLVRRERPCVVVCDLDMPGFCGADISAALLADASTADIPLIYLTNLATPDELSDLGDEISGRPCVSKRAPVAKLMTMIDVAAGRRRQRRAAPATALCPCCSQLAECAS